MANAIILLRESLGNMDPDTLNVLLRRPLGDNILQNLDFSPNPAFIKGFNPAAWGLGSSTAGGGAEVHQGPRRCKIMQDIERMEKEIEQTAPWSAPPKATKREPGATPVSRSVQPQRIISRTSPRTPFLDESGHASVLSPQATGFQSGPNMASNLAAASHYTSDTNMTSTVGAMSVPPGFSMASKMAATSGYTPDADMSSKMADMSVSQKTNMASKMAADYSTYDGLPPRTNMASKMA
ncbi:MAG: hypothetical protein AB2693_27320, partial [Candidatus Thiodiazotropha sp.]